MLEMQYVLELWLGNPPQHTASLCRCLLGALIIDRLTHGPMLAVNAYGKIAQYEMVQGVLLISVLPFIWIFYALGYGVESVGLALLISMTLYCLGRLCFAMKLVSYPAGQWMKEVMFPVLLILSVASLVGFFWMQAIPSGFVRVVITSIWASFVVVLLAWLFALNKNEKGFVLSCLRGIIKQIF